jgi:hypothetical protein
MSFPEKFKARTKSIGLAIIQMVQELPNIPVVWVLSKQICGVQLLLERTTEQPVAQSQPLIFSTNSK